MRGFYKASLGLFGGFAVGAGWESAYSGDWISATDTGCLMTIGYIVLVILGLLAAGGLMYGANKMVKGFDQRDGPVDGED